MLFTHIHIKKYKKKMIRYMFSLSRYVLSSRSIDSHNRKRRQNINSFEFENVYICNIIYQLVAPETLLHVAWLYGG